jgi:hypothetical protein
MEIQPLCLSLEPLFTFSGRRVEIWREAVPDSLGAQRALEATIELNRSIELTDGSRYTIQPLGGRWSPDRALWSGGAPTPGDTPLAVHQRQRVGILRWRSVVRAGPDLRQEYLFRRRSGWGGPANVDVTLAPPEGQEPQPTEPVLMRVERVGRLRRSLRAQAFKPGTPPILLVVFMLNLLAVQERAAASSAG